MDAYQRSASSEVTFDNVVYTTVVFEDSSSMIEIITDAPEGYHADNYLDNAAHQQQASNAGDFGGQHASPHQRDLACGLSDETQVSYGRINSTNYHPSSFGNDSCVVQVFVSSIIYISWPEEQASKVLHFFLTKRSTSHPALHPSRFLTTYLSKSQCFLHRIFESLLLGR